MRAEGMGSRIYTVQYYRFTFLAGFLGSSFTNKTDIMCGIFRIKYKAFHTIE